MKNLLIFLFLIVFTSSFAQLQVFNLKETEYIGKIVKVEMRKYHFEKKYGNYIVSTSYISHFDTTGNVILQDEEDFVLHNRRKTYYNYNKDNRCINYEMIFQNGESIKTFFKYDHGKFVEVSNSGKNANTIKYEYDKNGHLLTEKMTNVNGKSTNAIYENYKDNFNYKKETTNYSNGVKTSIEIINIKNNRIEIYRIIDYDKGKEVKNSFYTYKYDKYGKVIEEIFHKNNPSSTSHNTFERAFDLNGNILKEHEKNYSITDKAFYHSFIFIQYTYQDGTTTGSPEFDEDFVKKFDKL